MDLNIETLAHLQEMKNESRTNEELFDDMLRYLHYQINQKDIEFNSEILKRFRIYDDDSLKFDEGFFETGNYNPLFVLMAALADQEVHTWLEFAYNKTHNEKFSIDILENEISKWEKEGLTVILPTYHTLYKDKNDPGTIYQENTFLLETGYLYSISVAEAEDIGNNNFKISVYVGYRNQNKEFSANVTKSQKLTEILDYVMIKKFDNLYFLIRDQIDNEIIQWTKSIEEKKRH